MKTYFITMWKLGLFMLTEYWWFYLALTVVLTVLTLKYEKQIIECILRLLYKVKEGLLDYEETLEQK